MTSIEKLEYDVMTEIDVYINMLQEDVITDKEVIKFVSGTVIPRMNTLRDQINKVKGEMYEAQM